MITMLVFFGQLGALLCFACPIAFCRTYRSDFPGSTFACGPCCLELVAGIYIDGGMLDAQRSQPSCPAQG
jgi:hypothetical protein